MRRLLELTIKIGIFLFLCWSMAGAQTPVPLPITGNISAITGNGTPYAGVYIQLANCPSPASIPGVSVIAPLEYQIQANGSGQINSTVWPNDKINCNGTTGASQYILSYVANGTTVGTATCYQVVSTQANWNLNTQQPITCTQTPPNPQDVTWNNVVVNQNLQGNTAQFQTLTVAKGGTSNFGVLNAVVKAEQSTGASIDAKLAAACAALPSTGGTIDARGFGGGPQVWQAGFSCGSATKRVVFIFDPATLNQAATASLNLWTIEPSNVIQGFTFDCGNQAAYTGTVLQNDTTVPFLNSNNGDQTKVENYHVSYNCASISETGTAFELQSTSGTNGVEFFGGNRIRINGLGNGVVLSASGTGYVNGNLFSDLSITGSLNQWVESVSTGGTIEGNRCINCSLEQIPNSNYGFVIQGATGNIRYNTWSGSAWDFGVGTLMNVTAPYTVFFGNSFDLRADGSCTGNCPGVPADTGYNSFVNIRFATTSAARFLAAEGGTHLITHSGFGLYFDAADIAKTMHAYVNASGQLQIDQPTVGTAAVLDGTGSGTVKAGSGAGTFYGGFVYAGTGSGIAIPTGAASGSHLFIAPSTISSIEGQTSATAVLGATGSYASGNLFKADANGAATDAGFAASAVVTAGTVTAGHASCVKAVGPPIVFGYCSTTVDASGLCTCN